MKRLSSSLLAACLLLCSGLAQDCDWDRSIEPDQALDLDLTYLKVGDLESITAVSDPDSCLAACCDKPGCDTAVVGFPADGGPQCMLVTCLVRGRDVCVFNPSTQFKVHRRKVKTESRGEAEDGGKRRIVPLLGSGEPKSNDSNNLLCRLPMKVGSCRASFPKFFYNVTNQSCQKFIYGGCENNGNNFDSQEECEATCSGVTGSVLPDESTRAPPQLPVKAARMAPPLKTDEPQAAEGGVESTPAASETEQVKETEMSADDFAELCGAEPKVGPCRAAFQRWYYNTETRSCHSFIYGGCKGNKNNHASKESCMAACTVTVLPSSKKASSDGEMSPEFEDQCTMSPDPGPCRAAFPMFYHDLNTGTCRSFIYGGCHGNQNRYSSVEECMSQCTKEGSFDGRGRARNRWTAAVSLFVTLAAISVLLLAALIVMIMRRHNLPRSPSSVSDKEELLPDEQSSVESLNVPESPQPNKA